MCEERRKSWSLFGFLSAKEKYNSDIGQAAFFYKRIMQIYAVGFFYAFFDALKDGKEGKK